MTSNKNSFSVLKREPIKLTLEYLRVYYDLCQTPVGKKFNFPIQKIKKTGDKADH